jgi:hypothetical protein
MCGNMGGRSASDQLFRCHFPPFLLKLAREQERLCVNVALGWLGESAINLLSSHLLPWSQLLRFRPWKWPHPLSWPKVSDLLSCLGSGNRLATDWPNLTALAIQLTI